MNCTYSKKSHTFEIIAFDLNDELLLTEKKTKRSKFFHSYEVPILKKDTIGKTHYSLQ